jgi:hypothetical protein
VEGDSERHQAGQGQVTQGGVEITRSRARRGTIKVKTPGYGYARITDTKAKQDFDITIGESPGSEPLEQQDDEHAH